MNQTYLSYAFVKFYDSESTITDWEPSQRHELTVQQLVLEF